MPGSQRIGAAGAKSRAALSRPTATVDDLSGRELVRLLDEELDKLPLHYREPLILCYLEGLTQDEAAGRLGVSQSTLKSQLKRARQKLAAALGGRGCELGAVLLLVAASAAQGSWCKPDRFDPGGGCRRTVTGRENDRPKLIPPHVSQLCPGRAYSPRRVPAPRLALLWPPIGSTSGSAETQEPRPAIVEKETPVLSRIGRAVPSRPDDHGRPLQRRWQKDCGLRGNKIVCVGSRHRRSLACARYPPGSAR